MEIEFKFCIPLDRLAAVQAALRRGRCTAIRMEARYFDTPDGALGSRGIAFRLRREGDQWVQTVKALGDGPLDRQEHNPPVNSRSMAKQTPSSPRSRSRAKASIIWRLLPSGWKQSDSFIPPQPSGCCSRVFSFRTTSWPRPVVRRNSLRMTAYPSESRSHGYGVVE